MMIEELVSATAILVTWILTANSLRQKHTVFKETIFISFGLLSIAHLVLLQTSLASFEFWIAQGLRLLAKVTLFWFFILQVKRFDKRKLIDACFWLLLFGLVLEIRCYQGVSTTSCGIDYIAWPVMLSCLFGIFLIQTRFYEKLIGGKHLLLLVGYHIILHEFFEISIRRETTLIAFVEVFVGSIVVLVSLGSMVEDEKNKLLEEKKRLLEEAGKLKQPPLAPTKGAEHPWIIDFPTDYVEHPEARDFEKRRENWGWLVKLFGIEKIEPPLPGDLEEIPETPWKEDFSGEKPAPRQHKAKKTVEKKKKPLSKKKPKQPVKKAGKKSGKKVPEKKKKIVLKQKKSAKKTGKKKTRPAAEKEKKAAAKNKKKLKKKNAPKKPKAKKSEKGRKTKKSRIK